MTTPSVEPPLPTPDYAYGYVVARAIRAVGDMTPQGDEYPDGPPITMPGALLTTLPGTAA